MNRCLVSIALLAAALLVPGVVRAACTQSTEMRGYCDTRGEAYAFSEQLAITKGGQCAPYGFKRAAWVNPPTIANAEQHWVVCANSSGGDSYWTATRVDYNGANGGCPVDAPWDEATRTCKPAFDSAACLARNEDLPQSNVVVFSGSVCMDGCEYGEVSVNRVTVGGQTIRQGQLGYTGNSCGTNPPPPTGFDPETPPSQACVPAGAGQTVCVKPDGQHCYSGPIGRSMQFCWRPGETGQKTDGDAAQVRGPGTTPPTGTPPPGETLNPSGDPITSTSELTNGATVTTTTQTFTTGSGTDAGDGNDGEPSDGSGGPGSGGDGDEGSAGGGAGCDAPPVCSGDPVNCAILEQTWRNRCSGNGNKVVDGGCGAEGGVLAFTCSGDEIMCKQALVAKEQQCRAQHREDALSIDAGAGDGEDGFDLGGLWKQGTGQELDDDILQLQAAELFPEVELAPGQVFGTPEGLEDLLAKIRLIIVAGFMILAAFIAGGIN